MTDFVRAEKDKSRNEPAKTAADPPPAKKPRTETPATQGQAVHRHRRGQRTKIIQGVVIRIPLANQSKNGSSSTVKSPAPTDSSSSGTQVIILRGILVIRVIRLVLIRVQQKPAGQSGDKPAPTAIEPDSTGKTENKTAGQAKSAATPVPPPAQPAKDKPKGPAPPTTTVSRCV